MEFKSPQTCEELSSIIRRCAVTRAGLHWSSMCTARSETEVLDAAERLPWTWTRCGLRGVHETAAT